MYAVGVDVSNGWSTVAVLRSKTDIVIRPFNVTHNGAVDKVPEIKRQGRFQARKKMPFGITLSI